METKDDSLESSTISALLSCSFVEHEILSKFSSHLKTNFENRNLWLRFGLTLTLLQESPRSAIQAFNECLRIDQYDPLPAMLAAKLALEDLDDPELGLELALESIERCRRLLDSDERDLSEKENGNNNDSIINNNNIDSDTQCTTDSVKETRLSNDLVPNKCDATIKADIVPKLETGGSGGAAGDDSKSKHYLEARCCYKNIQPLLSRCYLLASIMHAHIYEREPESIKQFKTSNLKSGLHFLDLAAKAFSEDYLVHFHKALHEARQKSYSTAIDNIRQAIKLNPHHVPSMQLLILSLSALKLYNEALVLCESTLHKFEDNLLLLYIKCNLEQCLVETKGYKKALSTAQHILKCIRRSPERLVTSESSGETKQTTNLFADDKTSQENELDCFSEELSVWILVAEIFIKIGSISDAELCVDEGSTHAGGALSYQIMFVRGLISKAKNNLIEAKSFFQSCLALCPRHANALQQMAHVHYLLGNYSTAEKFLKDSLDVDSDSHKTWHYLSLVYIETNQHDKAKECVKKATTLEESSPVIPISAISRLTLI